MAESTLDCTAASLQTRTFWNAKDATAIAAMATGNTSTTITPPIASEEMMPATTDTDLRGMRSMTLSAVNVPRKVPIPATPNTAAYPVASTLNRASTTSATQA